MFWIPWQAFLLVMFLGVTSTQAARHFRYMTSHCSQTLQVRDSLTLSLTSPDNLPDLRDGDFLHCDLLLLAVGDRLLLVHVLQLAISPVTDHSDRLQLYNGNTSRSRLTPINGLYGHVERSSPQDDEVSANQLKDYRTTGRSLRLDYLGKPTKSSPGFLLLVTSFTEPGTLANCPPGQFLCGRAGLCIEGGLICDGNNNCGASDESDERDCDRLLTVTDLLSEYSLARDIMLVCIFPPVAFLLAVVFIFLLARRYIRHHINKHIPAKVHFRPSNDGKVTISVSPCDPPSYQDVVKHGRMGHAHVHFFEQSPHSSGPEQMPTASEDEQTPLTLTFEQLSCTSDKTKMPRALDLEHAAGSSADKQINRNKPNGHNHRTMSEHCPRTSVLAQVSSSSFQKSGLVSPTQELPPPRYASLDSSLPARGKKEMISSDVPSMPQYRRTKRDYVEMSAGSGNKKS